MAMNTGKWLSILVLSWAAACSSSTTTASSDDQATTQQNLDAGGEALITVQQALASTDTIFNFDPTLHPDATPDQNAATIETQVKAGATCAMVTRTLASLTIDYGSGCTANGIMLSGKVTIGLTRAGGATTLELTFANFSANAKSFSGTASFVTTNGSTFAVALDLTSGSESVAGNVTVVGTVGSFTVDGPLSVTQGSSVSAVTIKGLTKAKGQCYPAAGTVTVAKGSLPPSTIAFSAATATSGTVQVTTGKLTIPEQLPKYGSCPTP